MEQTHLVQRAVQRLRDNIARRETTLDLDAIKSVLVEMDAQKKRADALELSMQDHRELERELRIANAALVVRGGVAKERDTARALLAEVELHLWAHLEDLREERDRLTFEVVSALHDKVVLFLSHEAPER